MTKNQLTVFLILIIGIPTMIAISLPEDDTIVAKPIEVLTRQDSIRKCFSSWDGSHINLKNSLIQSLNDPGSFEHVETTYSDMGEIIKVKMIYRAKNGFGALILSEILVETDINGNILKVIE